MSKENKRNIIILLTSVFVLMFFISAGLTNLKMKPGMPLPEINSGNGTLMLENVPINDFVKKIFLMIIAALCVIFIIKMIIKIKLKKMLETIINVLFSHP
jgi:hypothetical protein